MSSYSKSHTSNKRRIHEIDDTIENLTYEINNLKDFVSKSEFECSLMTVKLKRERVKALTAVAKSKVLLADMEVLIAESDLYMDLERLKNCKKMKLDDGKGNSQQNITQEIRKPATNSVIVQTTKTMLDKTNKKKSSSSRKSPVDISTDETVIIPTILETRSLLETSQSSLSIELLNGTHKQNSQANSFDSEVSLSSSIKAEFNKPYTKPNTPEPEKNNHVKKTKSDKKVDSKSKSSRTQSPTIKTKTVAEINKTIFNLTSNNIGKMCNTTTKTSRPHHSDKKSTAPLSTSTYVPVRHSLPKVITQPQNMFKPVPSTSTSPSLYVNIPVTQPNMHHFPGSGMNTQSFNFYGSQQ